MSSQAFAIRLMEHLVVPTFVLEPNGRVIIWNRACQRLTGLPAKEVLGTTNHWRGFYDAPRPCLADLVLRGQLGQVGDLYIEQAFAEAGQTWRSVENWCVMPRAGSRRYLAIDAGPVFDEAGELLAVVETLRDITAQKEAQAALAALASSDGLTGLANRRSFDEHLEKEWRRSQRERQHLSLLMIDIDHFKQFNDAAGHQAGDQCLKRVSRAIADQMLRPGDRAARYGGEEFVVLLPNTEASGALIVADRIMAGVAALNLTHPAKGTRVTVSIGAASHTPTTKQASASLLALADSALYQAKRDGRDTVAIAHGEPGAESPTDRLAIRLAI